MSEPSATARSQLDRSDFALSFEDGFTDASLDSGHWIAHYLPHWTTPECSAARYALGDGLHLLIEFDQPPWLPEDSPMRVSNLQSGVFSGPRDSDRGQHRHRNGLRVRSPQQTHRLWTPTSGLVEVTMSASPDPTCLTAAWLVGLEDDGPEHSGEICIAELFGDAIGPGQSRVRLGVKAHHDPHLQTRIVDLVLPLDATERHSYAAAWDTGRVDFYVDDVLVHSDEQGLDYPLTLMLDLFEFPAGERRDASEYPKSAHIAAVRGYHRR